MRVLVVSRSSAFATIVETGGHDVIEARLGDAHSWRDPDEVPACDVVLIDVPDLSLVDGFSALLSQMSIPPAQVLIEGVDEAWAGHDLDVDVSLQPPLGRETVLAAIDVAWSRRHPGEPAAEYAGPAEVADELVPVGDDVRTHSPTTDTKSPAAHAVVGVRDGAAALAGVAHDVATVPEVAASVTEAAAEALDAEAAALLCADGDQWSVVGGVGTRSLEMRISLPPEHWLIERLVAHRRGAIIDRSDIVRSELINAPLASRDHLVIVCDHSCDAVLMVGRDGEPFSQDDLRKAHSLLREASPYLLDALALHDLTLTLERFRELR